MTGTGLTQRIVRPERVPVRTVWPYEGADFTPWLGANLEFLDDIGLGRLSLLGIEATLPGLNRSLDILAETIDGRRVAIENQYSVVDHDHLTRGLAYAVGHKASALVVVAEQHLPEFVAVADYLNGCQEALADETGIGVFLVELTVERVNESYIPRFAVRSRPNAWRAAVAAAEGGRFGSAEDFLAACDDRVRPAAERIVAQWQERRGAIRTNKTSISLAFRNSSKAASGVTWVFVLYTNGQLTLNRGYLVDGALVADVDALDAQIRADFPGGRWGQNSYYISMSAPPDAEAIDSFHGWLSGYVDQPPREAPESVGLS
jgi:hypothetical protein